MLTAEGCQLRRDRFWKLVPDEIDWAVIADPRHINYFSAFWIHPVSFSAGEQALLLLERSGKATLLADNFARRSAAVEPFVDDEIIMTWYDHQHSVTTRHAALHAAVLEMKKRTEGRGILEANAIAFDLAVAVGGPDDEAMDLGPTIAGLRRQKEADEVELLQKCMAAGEAGHARAFDVVKPGVTDFDVYREVQTASLAAAGEPAIVYGDFRTTNATTPKAGGLPVGHTLEAGELFILDFSVVINGYRSDFTNTIAVGEPTNAQQELFKLCEQALASGETALIPSTTGRDVHAAASKPFVDSGRVPIPHHAGHGIGLAHPELPIFVPESDDKLQVGDVVTLEPGVYEQGVGGMRIERNYLMTVSGPESLSNHQIAIVKP